nr:hypothetical protein [uncultured Chryseobacterium sp.]
MNILENRDISFVKTKKEGKFPKYADTDDWDMVHVTGIFTIQTMEEIIKNIDFAVKDYYGAMNHDDVTTMYDNIAFITL